jgi:Skp family chaperone for outer membrane proteins
MRAVHALLLVIALSSAAFAQTTPSRQPAEAAAAQTTRSAVVLETDAREVRQQLAQLLNKYPPELGRILKMDPTMLSNQQYLAQYPSVQQFLAVHPEVVRNPSFYLDFVRLPSDYTRAEDPQSRAMDMWRTAMEGVFVFAIIIFVASMMAWLVKTILNHRRWLRTSRVQTEVHNKLLERFSGTNELLTYVQTSAGRRFLEAAPIPVEAPAERPVGAAISRILWSVQAGIVLVVGGLGFQYVSGSLLPEVGQGMRTIGVLATAFGLGFVAAGAFSYVMSRRLGLLEPLPPARDERGDSPAI